MVDQSQIFKSFESHRNFKTEIFVTFWLPISQIKAQIVLFSDSLCFQAKNPNFRPKNTPSPPNFNENHPIHPFHPFTLDSI